MIFIKAVQTCFQKSLDFKGRAGRSEYWYFALFNALLNIVVQLSPITFNPNSMTPMNYAMVIVGIAVAVPSLAVSIRRLHDIDRSGWTLLLYLIPVVGWILLLIWHLKKGDEGENRFGTAPTFPSIVQ